MGYIGPDVSIHEKDLIRKNRKVDNYGSSHYLFRYPNEINKMDYYMAINNHPIEKHLSLVLVLKIYSTF